MLVISREAFEILIATMYRVLYILYLSLVTSIRIVRVYARYCSFRRPFFNGYAFFFVNCLSSCLRCVSNRVTIHSFVLFFFIVLQQQRHPPLVLGWMFLVLPFLPASNLLITVGFVIAERVLYISR